MEQQSSIVDERAIDPFIARLALDRLRSRAREAILGTTAAFVLAAAALILGRYAIAVPAAAGAVAGAVVAALARADRLALVHRLVHQRSAYEIAEVAAVAQVLVTPQSRARLARALGQLILEADGFEPANPLFTTTYERVREHRDDLLGVAFHLARPDSRVHPTAVALLVRLLAQANVSPLHNAQLPSAHLRVALLRAQAAINS